jgi:parvulin-like peptidyl-prolyl isomerase
LPVKTLSDPVRSELGAHVIWVDEIKARPFEEVRSVVRAQALQGADEVYEELLRTLRREADVEISDEFGRWDRTNIDAIRLAVE